MVLLDFTPSWLIILFPKNYVSVFGQRTDSGEAGHLRGAD